MAKTVLEIRLTNPVGIIHAAMRAVVVLLCWRVVLSLADITGESHTPTGDGKKHSVSFTKL